MNNYLGSYKAKETKRYIAGGCSFEFSSGNNILVTQVDKEFRKVLVNFGSDCIDWFHYSILDNFTKE